MIDAVLNAAKTGLDAAKKPQPKRRVLQMADGAEYEVPANVNQAYVDQVVNYHEQRGKWEQGAKRTLKAIPKLNMGEGPKPKKVTPITPEMILESQGIVDQNIRQNTGIGATQKELNTAKSEGKRKFIKQYGFDPDKYPARAAQVQSQEFTGKVADFISPVTDKVGEVLALSTPAIGIAEKGKLVEPGIGGKLFTGAVAQAISAPVDIGLDAGVILHPNSSMRDRAGGFANIALQTGVFNPLDVAKTAVKGIKAAIEGVNALKDSGKAAGDVFEGALKNVEGGGIPKRSLADAPDFPYAGPDIAKTKFRPTQGSDSFIKENWKQRTEGLVNALSQEIEKAGTSKAQRIKKATYAKLRTELRNSLESGTPHASVKSELTDIWNAKKAKTPVAPKVEAPKVEEPPAPIPPKSRPESPKAELKPPIPTKTVPEGEGQGIAHADVDQLREDIGWEPRIKGVKPDANLFKEAKKHSGREEQIAQHVLDNSKRTLTDDESLALGMRLKQAKSEMNVARAANDADAYLFADDAAQKIANALDESGTRQGRAFRARQFVAMEDDSWALRRRLEKKVNTGEIPKASREPGLIEEQIKKVEEQETAVETLRTQDVEEVVKAASKKGPRMTREELDKELDDLFTQFTQKAAKISSGIDPDLLPVIGKIAINRAKRIGLTLEDTIKATIDHFKAGGHDISREDVIQGIARATEGTPRTVTQAQKDLNRLTAEAKKIAKMYDEGASVPTKEAKRLSDINDEVAKLEDAIKTGDLPTQKPKAEKVRSAKLEVAEANLKAKRRAVRSMIENANLTKGQRLSRKLGGASTEVKLWNPLARTVDIGSTIQEAATSAITSVVERPIANLASKLLGSDAKWSGVPLKQRGVMFDRWKLEVKKAFQEAKVGDPGKYGVSGPASKLAGAMDTPGRAFHFLGYAGERAQAIAKNTGKDFESVLDHIRNPESPGPLTQREAFDIHNAAKDFTEINMLTNANWASRTKSAASSLITRSVPEALQPVAHLVNDLTFQFGRVLVNVADKTGQYSNPFYGVGRAAFELLPNKGTKIAKEARVRQFAQIVRRTGAGAGMAYLGAEYYKSGQRIPEAGQIPLGSTIVRVMKKGGGDSGSLYQDDGYIAMLGGMTAAFMTGYRNEQIDAQKQLTEGQREKMKRDLMFAPITDNPVTGNASRIFRSFDLGKIGDTAWEIFTGMYYPGGLREWANAQDKQEGVFGRRAEGPVENVQKRVPYIQKSLKPKGRAESK